MSATPSRALGGFVRRQWWVVLQAIVVGTGIGLLIANRTPEHPYRSEAKILINTPSTVAAAGTYLSGQAQVVTSTSVLAPVASQFGLSVDVVADHTAVVADSRAQTLVVRFADADPQQSIAVTNAIVAEYLANREVQQGAPLRREIASAGSDVTDFQASIDTLQAAVDRAAPNSAELSKATADLETARSRFTAAVAHENDLQIELSKQVPVAELLSTATSASKPTRPSLMTFGLIGAALGFLGGMLLAVGRDALDDRVHSRRRVESVANRPVIAEIPFDPRANGGRRHGRVPLANIERPNSTFSESIRSLRTTVTFLGIDAPIRCLTITSGEPDEGKSIIAANLAVAYAQSGVRTILMSGDLRRPSLDGRMLPDGSLGFSDVIARSGDDDDLSFAEVCYRTTIANLTFVPAGTPPPNPAELIASRRAAAFVADLRSECEMLIIDSPPTVVTDGVILASFADAALVVAANDQTHAARLADALDSLASGHVRVLGVVFNKVRHRLGDRTGTVPSPLNGAETRSDRQAKKEAKESVHQARAMIEAEARQKVEAAKRAAKASRSMLGPQTADDDLEVMTPVAEHVPSAAAAALAAAVPAGDEVAVVDVEVVDVQVVDVEVESIVVDQDATVVDLRSALALESLVDVIDEDADEGADEDLFEGTDDNAGPLVNAVAVADEVDFGDDDHDADQGFGTPESGATRVDLGEVSVEPALSSDHELVTAGGSPALELAEHQAGDAEVAPAVSTIEAHVIDVPPIGSQRMLVELGLLIGAAKDRHNLIGPPDPSLRLEIDDDATADGSGWLDLPPPSTVPLTPPSSVLAPPEPSALQDPPEPPGLDGVERRRRETERLLARSEERDAQLDRLAQLAITRVGSGESVVTQTNGHKASLDAKKDVSRQAVLAKQVARERAASARVAARQAKVEGRAERLTAKHRAKEAKVAAKQNSRELRGRAESAARQAKADAKAISRSSRRRPQAGQPRDRVG